MSKSKVVNKIKILILIALALSFFSIFSMAISGGCCLKQGQFCVDASILECPPEKEGDFYEGPGCFDVDRCTLPGCCITPSTCEDVTQGRSCSPLHTFVPITSTLMGPTYTCADLEQCQDVCCVYYKPTGEPEYCEVVPAMQCKSSTDYTAVPEPVTDQAECLKLCQVTAPPRGSLEGVVRNNQGNPIRNAQIRTLGITKLTNTEGYYKFEEIGIGNLTVDAYASGYEKGSDKILITEGQTSILDFYLDTAEFTTGTLMGSVKDTFGNPIREVYVSWSEGGTYTNQHGEFTLSNIKPGYQKVTAAKHGYQSETSDLNIISNQITEKDFIIRALGASELCGNNIIDPGEECDGTDDEKCPGYCLPNCQCPSICEQISGASCAPFKYLCDNVGGKVISFSNKNLCPGVGNQAVCCDRPTVSVPICEPGHISNKPISNTDTSASGGTMCRCGDDYYDTRDPSQGSGYCCSGIYTSNPCTRPGMLKGFVLDKRTKEGISSALVKVTNVGQTYSKEYPEGEYDILLSPGIYNVEFSKEGYETKRIQNVRIISAQTEELTVELEEEDITCTEGHIPGAILEIEHTRGISALTLKWKQECIDSIIKFDIHMGGSIIKSFAKDQISLSGGYYTFVDEYIDWDMYPSYYITSLTKYGETVYSNTITVYSGNSICENKRAGDEFCSDITTRATCDARNQIDPKEYCTRTNPNSKCIYLTETKTACSDGSACKDFGITRDYIYNTFGLYYWKTFTELTTETCEAQNNFCYLDYSETLTDFCYDCSPIPSCYDYNSKYACERDSCSAGYRSGGTCEWEPSKSFWEFGKGVCYLEGYSGEEYCSECSETNPILFMNARCDYDICTKLGACYPDKDQKKCVPCGTTKCENYKDQESCEGGVTNPTRFVTCGSNETITISNDPCGLNTCRWIGNSCVKDANTDGKDDCGPTDETCRYDNTPPVTRALNVPAQLTTNPQTISFSVTDTNEVNETYYCLGDGCCPDTPVVDGEIKLPNEKYQNIINDYEGETSLRFFSVDVYNNIEPINDIKINVQGKIPDIELKITITNNTATEDTSDLNIEITTNKAVRCVDSLRGSGVLRGRLVEDKTTVTYLNLADGTYPYTINCTDFFGNSFYRRINIRVDRIAIIYDEFPSETFNKNTDIRMGFKTVGEPPLRCRYRRTEPTLGSWIKFPPDGGLGQFNGVDYSYEDVLGSPPYQPLPAGTNHYEIECYKDIDTSMTGKIEDRTDIIFTVDTVPPTTTPLLRTYTGYLELEEDGIYKSTSVIKLDCQDKKMGPPPEFGCALTEYCLTSSNQSCHPSTTYEGEFSFAATKSGKHTLCYSSTDLGENKEETECMSIILDREPPTVRITRPRYLEPTGTRYIEVVGEWSDDVDADVYVRAVDRFGRVRTNVKAYKDATNFYANVHLFSGYNKIVATAVDKVGNIATDIVEMYYDTYGPELDNFYVYSFNRITNETDLPPEYGYRLNITVRAIDERYGDRLFEWTAVDSAKLEVKCITPDTCGSSSFGPLTMRRNEYYHYYEYEPNVLGILRIGNYQATITARDIFGNENTEVFEFDIQDTRLPEFMINILGPTSKNPLTGQTRITKGETYSVLIESTKPLESISTFGFDLLGFPARNIITRERFLNPEKISQFLWKYNDIKVPDNPYFMNIQGNNSRFIIEARDINNKVGGTNQIISGGYFEIDTFGGGKVNLVPLLKRETNEPILDLTGFTNPREPGITLEIKLNNEIYTTESYPKNEELGSMLVSKKTEKNLIGFGSFEVQGDQTSLLSKGSAVEFGNHQRKHGEYYGFTNFELTSEGNTRITLSENLERNINDNEKVSVYRTKEPMGWFRKVLELREGENYIEITPIDDLGNVGETFEKGIYFDNKAFEVLTTIPNQGDIANPNSKLFIALKDNENNLNLDDLHVQILGPKGKNLKCSTFGISELICNRNETERVVTIEYETPLDLGENIVIVYGTDSLGNYDEHSFSFEIKEGVPDRPEISFEEGNLFYRWFVRSRTPVFELTFNSPISEIPSISGTGSATCLRISDEKFRCSFSGNLPKGPHYLSASADGGAWGYDFTVDVTPPEQISINKKDFVNPNGAITGDYFGPDIFYIEIKEEGKWSSRAEFGFGKYSAKAGFDKPEGNKTVIATAYDYALNHKSVSANMYYYHNMRLIDLKPVNYSQVENPLIEIELDRNATCEIKGHRVNDWTQMSMGASSSQSTIYRHQLPRLEQGGPYDYEIKCKPIYEIQDTKSYSLSFIVDSIPPQIQIISPKSGEETVNGTILVKGRTEPNSWVQLHVEDIEQSPWILSEDGNFEIEATLVNKGTNLIKVLGKDRAGNSGSTSIDIYYINLGPKITYVYPFPGSKIGSINGITAWIKKTANDIDIDNSEIIVRRDGELVDGRIITTQLNTRDADYSIRFESLGGFTDGTYYVQVIAKDDLGNIGTENGFTYFTINNKLPTIVIESPTALRVNNPIQDFKATITTSQGELTEANLFMGDLSSIYYSERFSISNLNTQSYTIRKQESFLKSEGHNYYLVEAQNNQIKESAHVKKVIVLDTIGPVPNLRIQNSEPSTQNLSWIRLKRIRPEIYIEFDEEILPGSLDIKLEKSTGELVNLQLLESLNNERFTYRPVTSLQDLAEYTISISAKDTLENLGETLTKNLLVDLGPMEITLINPSFEVSPVPTFDFIIGTDRDADCRFSPREKKPRSEMQPFDITGSETHTLSGVSSDEEGFIIYVNCYDKIKNNETERSFNLSVDTIDPKILYFSAEPRDIAEEPVESKITIKASEPVRCKYSKFENTNFENMNPFADFEFGEFTDTVEDVIGFPKTTTNYTLYFMCEDKAERKTKEFSMDVSVDLTAPLRVRSNTPKYFAINNASINVTTNKRALCYYDNKTPSLDVNKNPIGMIPFVRSGSGSTEETLKHSTSLPLGTGSYTFYVMCSKDLLLGGRDWSEVLKIDFIVDGIPPKMLYVNASICYENNDKFLLHGSWRGQDDESGVNKYYVDIYESRTFSENIKLRDEVLRADTLQKSYRDLNINETARYFFEVRAEDRVGLKSDSKRSEEVVANKSIICSDLTSCTNGILDGDETDVDCGGNCPPCADGKKCIKNSDCYSDYCNPLGICSVPTCFDGFKNGNETDVDCGGDCPTKCAAGKMCNVDSDCRSGLCENGVCADTDHCFNNKYDPGLESDVDCGVRCSKKCEIGQNCYEHSDCESGNCRNGVCSEPSCSNRIQDGDESDVDCGGSCPPCADGKKCYTSTDCKSGVCMGGICQPTEISASGNWIAILILILAILALLGGGGYFIYTSYKKGDLDFDFINKIFVNKKISKKDKKDIYETQVPNQISSTQKNQKTPPPQQRQSTPSRPQVTPQQISKPRQIIKLSKPKRYKRKTDRSKIFKAFDIKKQDSEVSKEPDKKTSNENETFDKLSSLKTEDYKEKLKKLSKKKK